jgi:hypothetical protein
MMIKTYDFAAREELYRQMDLRTLHYALLDAQKTARNATQSWQGASEQSEREHWMSEEGYYLDDCSTIRKIMAEKRG